MPNEEIKTWNDFNKYDYTQRIVQVVQGLQQAKYQAGIKVVTPEFGGLWKFKLFIKGKSGTLNFPVTLTMLDGYDKDQLVEVIIKKLKRDKVVPYDKVPVVPLTPVVPQPKQKSLHPTQRLDGMIDLGQSVRMTCCKAGVMQQLGSTKFWVTSIQQGIIHLNDQHKWKREQIADWLESQDVDIAIG